MSLAAIDFEYNQANESHMGLISCALLHKKITYTYWLHRGQDREALVEKLIELRDTKQPLVGFFIADAEARCIAALGLDPLDFTWLDLSLAWRWLRSGENRFNYGARLKKNIKLGVTAIETEPPPEKYEEPERPIDAEQHKDFDHFENEIVVPHSKVGSGLLDALYFFKIQTLREIRASWEQKESVRNFIIQGKGIASRKEEILEYNAQDVKLLPALYEAIMGEMESVSDQPHYGINESDLPPVFEILTNISRQAVSWSLIAQRGLPLNKERLDELTQGSKELVNKLKRDFLAEGPWPIYKKEKGILKGSSILKQQYIANFIEKNPGRTQGWPKTKNGSYSTTAKTLDKYWSPGDELDQLWCHEQEVKSLNFFHTKDKLSGKIKALQFIGSDYRQRAFWNPFGSQTGRTQAKSTSFFFLQSKWLRCLVDPPEGYVFLDPDYASQEFLIQAILSGDRAMIEAYKTGDVYIAFGKSAGFIPPEGNKKTHPKERESAKQLLLGKGYGMGVKALWETLKAKVDENMPLEEAEKLSSLFDETYPDYYYFVKKLGKMKRKGISLYLPSGWRCGPDALMKSYCNFLCQGSGSEILRNALPMLREAGIEVVATLHDALTIMCKVEEVEEIRALSSKIMVEAAVKVLGLEAKTMRVDNKDTIVHGDFWDYKENAVRYLGGELEMIRGKEKVKVEIPGVRAKLRDVLGIGPKFDYDWDEAVVKFL